MAFVGLFGHVDGDVPTCGIAPCIDRRRVEHNVAAAGKGKRVAVTIRRRPFAHGRSGQGVGSGLLLFGIGVVGNGQCHSARQRLRNEQQVARHVRIFAGEYDSLLHHADCPCLRIAPRGFCTAVVVAFDNQPVKGNRTHRGVTSLAACREGDSCQQVMEGKRYRPGSLCLLYGNTLVLPLSSGRGLSWHRSRQ